MAEWFEWNGVRSTTKGLYVEEFPPITGALERLDDETITGRSGSVTLKEGDAVFDDVTLQLKCFTQVDTQIREAIGWISGIGKLKLGNQPNGFYYGHLSKALDFDKSVQGHCPYRAVTLNFKCRPFWYSDAGQNSVTITSSGTLINNPGTVPSEPLIKVTGSGDVTLMVGGSNTIILNDLVRSTPLYIDCESGFAFTGEGTAASPYTPANNQCEGDWPIIPTGSSSIVYTGSVSSLVIVPRWRWR